MKLLAAGVHGKEYIIVMEKLEKDLFDLVKGTPDGLSEDVALRYFRDMFLGLEHCHSRGILHRDLKLENAMLDVDGRVKLIDFGLANRATEIDDGAGGYSLVGTRAYVAPEIWEKSEYSNECDMWSMGVCLFVMLRKFFPFHMAHSTDVVFRRVAALQEDNQMHSIRTAFEKRGSSDRISVVSDEISDIFEGLLSINPKMRPTAAEMLKRLPESVSASGESLPPAQLRTVVTSDYVSQRSRHTGCRTEGRS